MRFRPPPFEITDRDKPFANDTMERRQPIEALTRLVGNIEGPCVLAVDAQWGFGKTAFLKMWAQHLRNEKFPVVEFNAWETDFSDDPLMALYATLEDHFGKMPGGMTDRHKTVLTTGLAVVSKAASTAIPFLPDIAETVDGAKERADSHAKVRLRRYRETREAIDRFKAALQEIRGKKPLVICVDELDRCRPTYAIEFLEATKHIFEVDGVIFILAVNLSELANSVSTLYGDEFNARAYLRRFVDRSMNLPAGDRHRFMRVLLKPIPSRHVTGPDNYASLFLHTFMVEGPQVSLRDIEQSILHLQMVLNAIPERPEDGPSLHLIATLLMTCRTIAPDTYRDFASGDISDLEALRAFNGVINRADNWWNTERLGRDERAGALLEALLISWAHFIDDEGPSELLERRRLEAESHSYANKVVRHAEQLLRDYYTKQKFSHVTALIEMVVYDPPS